MNWLPVGLRPPVDAPISQYFGENPHIYAAFHLPGHNGIDFACPLGTLVFPCAAGIIAHILEEPKGYGLYLVITHGNGYRSYYAHLSQVLVALGQAVASTEPIACSGNSGFSTGPHLHWGIRLDAPAVDDPWRGYVDPFALADFPEPATSLIGGTVAPFATAKPASTSNILSAGPRRRRRRKR